MPAFRGKKGAPPLPAISDPMGEDVKDDEQGDGEGSEDPGLEYSHSAASRVTVDARNPRKNDARGTSGARPARPLPAHVRRPPR